MKILGIDKAVPSMVQVHLLKVEKGFDKFPESGQRILEWLLLTEAAQRVREPELKGLFAKLAAKGL